MSTPKGFPSQQKSERLKGEHATIEPVREQQQALSVLAHAHVYEVGTKVLAAGCTKSTLITTVAHGAKKGDVIGFTSGALDSQQVKVVSVESATALTVGEDLPSVPAAAVTIRVMRHVFPVLAADGTQSVTATFAEEATVADGGALPAKVKVVGGYDGTNVQVIKTDAAGELQVDVLSSALPTGAATQATLATRASEATLASVLTALGPLATEATLSSIDSSIGSLGTEATLLNIESALGSLATEATLGSVLTALGPLATEATLASVLTALGPLGTEATLGSILTALGPLATEATLSNVETALGSLATEATLASVLAAFAPLATESTLLNVASLLAPKTTVALMDTPVLDASATNIPGNASLPLEVVAALSSQASKIRVNDTTGEFIGVYFGAVSSEVLAAVIGPGMDGETDLAIPASTRVSVKSMDVAAISVGKLCIQFLG